MRIIELGSEVRDRITGFRGIATSRAVHLSGCDRYWIEPKVDKDGKRLEGCWCDEGTIEVIQAPTKTMEGIRYSNQQTGGFPSRIK